MIAIARCSIYKAVEAVLEVPNCHKATVFQHPELTVVATRVFKPRKNERQIDIRLTIGKPNFRNAKFVKDCLAAGEPFPVRKVQLEYWPKK